jgi:hypothetical protein
VSLFLLAAPAVADDATDNSAATPADGVLADETQPYRLQWLQQKNEGDADASIWLSGDAQADAEFARNVRALLQRAREEVRLAAASPNAVALSVRVRCYAKRTVAHRQTRQAAFVPALAWSVEEQEDGPQIATKLLRACVVNVRSRGTVPNGTPGVPDAGGMQAVPETSSDTNTEGGPENGPGNAPVMRPFAIELPVSVQSN